MVTGYSVGYYSNEAYHCKQKGRESDCIHPAAKAMGLAFIEHRRIIKPNGNLTNSLVHYHWSCLRPRMAKEFWVQKLKEDINNLAGFHELGIRLQAVVRETFAHLKVPEQYRSIVEALPLLVTKPKAAATTKARSNAGKSTTAARRTPDQMVFCTGTEVHAFAKSRQTGRVFCTICKETADIYTVTLRKNVKMRPEKIRCFIARKGES